MIFDFPAFFQVVLVDLVLAGDNAVVIGALAASLPEHQRTKAILFGTGFAMVARVLFSLGVVWLLLIPYVSVIGGVLLLWVAWKMWKDLHGSDEEHASSAKPPQALHKAVIAIVAADLSMSLDNVLGVAGAAQGHILPLALGLFLSVALMGAAAGFIAGVINKHRWIGYVGLALIIFVAGRMIWTGF